MMTGRLYIDGADAYTTYGVYVIDDGWNDLLSMPPLKPVKSNNWQEEDGLDADLSNPVLNSRDISIKFAIRNSLQFNDFVVMLAGGAVHEFNCAEIGKTFHLRLVSQPNIELSERLGFFTLKFADDYPLEGYNYSPPSSTIMQDNNYLIDGRPFTNYGVRLIIGTRDEIVKRGDVKPAMTRNVETRAGVIYDTMSFVTFKSKDVKLYCLLRAESLAEMWANLYALCYDLVRPNARLLTVAGHGAPYKFHYKGCQVRDYENINGNIWVEFTLTVVFI